ncbi:GL19269 [Drosophila persimilis]|uniref:GL11691 n=1 Tax=Drosophila persimilis TaxID=7234 RepID=B4G8B3_DROPE|nr:GL11691 [Drosophila persimilis]EDW28593.1 GL19269 [Drosophila persimilis]
MDGVLTRIALGETPDCRGSGTIGHNCRHCQVTSRNCQAASANSCLKSCETLGDAVDDRVQPNNQQLRNERSSSRARSSANSSQSSVGIDDYWDEALVGDYGSTQNDDSDDLDGHNN